MNTIETIANIEKHLDHLEATITEIKAELRSITSAPRATVSPSAPTSHRPVVPSADRLIVHTDGACQRNGKKDAKAGSGIYFGEDDTRNRGFPVPGKQTNQRAEVWAVCKALEATDVSQPLLIVTDSMYTINCATGKWNIKANSDLFHCLMTLASGRDVQWKHVRGHRGNVGNEAADRIAVKAAQGIYDDK